MANISRAATLYKRGKKIWVRYSVVADGVRTLVREPTEFVLDAKGRIPKAAYDWLNKLALQLANERIGITAPTNRQPMRLSQLLEEHGKTLTRKDQPQSKSTLSNSLHAVNRLMEFLDCDPLLSEITSQKITEFRANAISSRSLSPSTAHMLIARLGLMLSYAVERGWISVNPVASVKNRLVRSHVSCPYSVEEVKAIFDYTHEHDIALNFQLRYLYYTATRGSDSCLAKPGWVDWEGKVVKTWNQKLSRFDSIPLYKELRELFDEMRETGAEKGYKDGYLFVYRKRQSLYQATQRVLDKLGIDHARTLHAFKYAAAQRVRRKGITADLRKILMHHSDESTLTKVYDQYDEHDMESLRLQLDDERESTDIESERLRRENAKLRGVIMRLEDEIADLEKMKLRVIKGGEHPKYSTN